VRMCWTIGEGVEVGIQVYKLVSRTCKPNYIWLDARTNEQLKLTSAYINERTGAPIMNCDIKRSYIYGGREVIFDREEVRQLKDSFEPSFLLF
jgi:non-homologous end joining protein Ku